MNMFFSIAVTIMMLFSLSVVAKASGGVKLPKDRKIAKVALEQRGTPYVWGGESRRGFDCSGLVKYVFRKIGIKLPHYTGSMWSYGKKVAGRRNLKRGDVMFFNGHGHVGIYLRKGKFVHASSARGRVVVSNFDSWYSQTYDGAKRMFRHNIPR